VYKFLNVDIASTGDVIHYSRTGPSLSIKCGEVTTLGGLVLDVCDRLVIDKQDVTTAVENMVKKNNNRFPIAILLTTLICNH
jgi:hypothetical protein